jgi:alkanesulfonate monooxygenase SsuD/methylene tetrahydromethanopterin reductase-like flavin-dependent oxidoreductase (luciferase family)
MLPRDLPAEQLVDFARRAEELGFAELWVVEDLGFAGGVAQAATALAATSTITVGIGIMPVGARNVAFAAMELTTLARLFPGRIRAGVGHGMPAWMRSVGAWPSSPLTLLEEYLRALRGLLHGEEVNVRGRYVHLDGVRLEAIADPVPRVLAGVRGPRSLAVAGKVADGVILAEPTAPEYVAQTVEHLHQPEAQVVAFALAAIDEDISAAVARIRPTLAGVGDPGVAAHLAALPFAADLAQLRTNSPSADGFAAALPQEWIRRLALAGSCADVQADLARVREAGAQTVVLIPVGSDPLTRLTEFGQLL